MLFGIAIYQSYTKDSSIYSTFKKGSGETTEIRSEEVIIQRPEEQENIRQLISREDPTQFGIILGPSGTGKTYLTRQVCRDSPSFGVVYYEIPGAPASFPEDLAREVGMKLSSSLNFVDVLVSKFVSPESVSYHKLPNDYTQSMEIVINTISKTGKRFKKNFGRTPCLIIDGVDLLVKFDAKAFVRLVDLAKIHANAGDLCLILVSSEGHVMPLIFGDTSSRTRMALVIEILDFTDEDALKYLTSKSVPTKVAKDVVECAGGRVIFLMKAAEVAKKFSQLSEDKLIQMIKNELEDLYVEPGLLSVQMNGVLAKDIVRVLLKSDKLKMRNISEILKDVEEAKVKNVVSSLVKANLLRYDSNGYLRWHSKLCRFSEIWRVGRCFQLFEL